jgi:acetoacetate decarboxylase
MTIDSEVQQSHDLKGYSLPLSARGTANIIGEPPWHYAGDLLGTEFWTTPEAANAALPAGLTPDPENAGHGWALFFDWQFTGENDEYLDPERSLYSEFMVVLDATYEGTPVAWCPFIYVDNAQAMARGWIQGFPKKFGTIKQTRAFRVPGKAASPVGVGGTFAAAASSAGHRLAESRVTLEQPSDTIPALTRPLINLRHFPRLTAGEFANPAVHELTQAILENPDGADIWTGTGDVSFFAAPGEELGDLNVVRTGIGFRATLSYSVRDLKILTGPDATS